MFILESVIALKHQKSSHLNATNANLFSTLMKVFVYQLLSQLMDVLNTTLPLPVDPVEKTESLALTIDTV